MPQVSVTGFAAFSREVSVFKGIGVMYQEGARYTTRGNGCLLTEPCKNHQRQSISTILTT